MRSFATAMFAAALLTAASSANAAGDGATELNLVRHGQSAAATLGVAENTQLIVKLRKAADLQTQGSRMEALAARQGLGLDGERSITSRIHVLQVRSAGAAGTTADEMLAQLRADPQVEYAVVDQRRHIQALTPNDPLYAQQWYLQAVSAATPAALDATDAWSTTTGNSSMIIADIDTGVRPDHPDLASKLVLGCFFRQFGQQRPGLMPPIRGLVTSGHQRSSAECAANSLLQFVARHARRRHRRRCQQQRQRRHGGWDAQILPVRALGKCGDTDSDIITAMLWSAGSR
jgi:serine protease